MKNSFKDRLASAGVFLLCILVLGSYELTLGQSEFSGGRITSLLSGLFEVGVIVLVVALLLTFFSRQIAACIGLAGTLLCLPVYGYFTAPGVFRAIFPGEYSTPLQHVFIAEKWTILGVIVIVFVVSFNLHVLFSKRAVNHSLS
ncbi:MAG TPA: hypothetical protein VFW31_02390 [Candidatus Angelobacter sp.]|nr:hypothetical protein [Candidatus Angelobacter sp.]